jgi:lysophospholipase L1-like esterase
VVCRYLFLLEKKGRFGRFPIPNLETEDIAMVKKLALVLFGSLISLTIAEGISRVIYTKPWYQSLVEIQQHKHNKHIANSLGLRDRDYSAVKPHNTKRVLILGDSFTYGSGVADDAVIFPELLEKRLNAEFIKQNITIEILNGGIAGSLTNQWVNLLIKVKDIFAPDVILVVFFLRDGTRTSSMASFFNPIRDELRSRHSVIYRYSYFYRLFQDAMDRNYLSAKYAKALNVSYLGGHEQTQEWEQAKANILMIKSIGDEIHARVGLVVFPVLVDLNDNYPFKEIYQSIVEFGRKNKIPTHGLLPAFIGKNGPELWVSTVDQHPNELGHQIASESMLPFLRQLLQDYQ